jgi:hypothetical protein
VTKDTLRVFVQYGGRCAIYRTSDLEKAKQVAVEGASVRITSRTGETLWTTEERAEVNGPLPEHAMFWWVAQRQTENEPA